MGQPIGELNWGPPLNQELAADEAQIAANTISITNHENNSPADPHGDRAYCDNQVDQITTGTNEPNGFVKLGPDGKIPLGLIPVGAGLTNWIDVVPDYNVPINGLSDASVSINAALYQTHLNGGGIIYVGNGTFGLANPLIIYPNTWLLCSPGAIFTRINLITPPFAMIQNFATGVLPGGSNIIISGGQWNIDSLTPRHSGAMFQFVNAGNIVVRDLIAYGVPDGNSWIGGVYGCTDVTIENVQIIGLAPVNTGRSNQHYPCFRVEECNSTNIPGCPNTTYSNQPCQDIRVRGCSHRCATLSDGFGTYTPFTSMCGSVGTVQSGNIHSNIVITDCFGAGFANAAIEVINWSNVTCHGNFFTYPKTVYVTNWVGVAAQIETFIFDVNTPRSYPCYQLAPCTNTLTETIVSQFLVPPNDWLPGTSCYRHRHSGTVSTSTLTDTLTIHLRCGPNGDITDTIIETITVTVSANQSVTPYTFEHCGFDIDGAGNWRSCGWRVKSAGFTVSITETISSTVFTPTPGVPLYFSHCVTWGHARSGQSCIGKAGCHERANL